ncbi:hypothetical protein C1646_758384 [Rhizophagus diaphanus]|nr:hypothetical protein C1646_758384 [Rhizophagus diaphanus] [Rhizophagus sp. MUCL 43196]
MKCGKESKPEDNKTELDSGSKSVGEDEVVEIVEKFRKNVALGRVQKESLITSGHVTPQEVVEVVEKLREEDKKKERLVTKLKKKKNTSGDEKVGQKRVSKVEISRGDMSDSDCESEPVKEVKQVKKKQLHQIVPDYWVVE